MKLIYKINLWRLKRLMIQAHKQDEKMERLLRKVQKWEDENCSL